MIIMEYLPLDVSGQHIYQTYEVLGQMNIVVWVSNKAWRILLPTGGAMIITEYWPLGVSGHDSYQTCEVWCILDLHVDLL